MNFFQKVYQIVRTIPVGKIMTYGQVAAMCGNPRASRVVGYALHVNPQPGIIPCHRIVNREGYLSGGFAFGGIEVQKALLEAEGVVVDAQYRVDLERFLWRAEK